MLTSNFPKQKIPRSKKDEEWGKHCLNALIDESSYYGNEKVELQAYYDVYNGILSDNQYAYVKNPYNTSKGKERNYPARIRNYPIIKQAIDLLLGEKANRPFNYQVVSLNEDSVNTFLEQQNQAVLTSIQNRFLQQLEQMGVDTQGNAPQQEEPEIQAVIEEQESSYRDRRSRMGQDSLDYMIYYCDIFDKYQTALVDWLVAGEVYTYKYVYKDDVYTEVVSPLDIEYDKSPDTQFVEDGDWVTRRKIMTVSQVIDRFHDVLTPEEIDNLEKPEEHRESGLYFPYFWGSEEEYQSKGRLIEVIHGQWKSFRKVGEIRYVDEYGITQTLVVDETYKPEQGEQIEWTWINQTWEGFRIDGRIYKLIRPVRETRKKMDNISENKLTYNGRKYSNRHSPNTSLVKLGIPYQILYNIFHYRYELAVAKNKGKIILMDINTIPTEHGWDEDKFMYHADGSGFVFVDSQVEGKLGRNTFNQWSVLDATLGDYIASLLDMMKAIKEEWEELVGITRPRKGQTTPSEGLGVTRQAIFQGSIITEETFRKFEKFEEKELQGLLDLSKYAWRDGKKAMYLNSDMRRAVLEVDGQIHQETEYAVFVKNTAKENDKLNLMKDLTLSFAQNKQSPQTVAEIIDSSSFDKLKHRLAKIQQAEQAMAEQAQQQQQQAEQQSIIFEKQLEEQSKQADRDHEMIKQDKDHAHEKDLEYIKVEGQLLADPNNPDPDVDIAKIEANSIQREKNAQDVSLKKEDQNIKREEIKSKERIEKLKAETALKNPVSGEKKPKK